MENHLHLTPEDMPQVSRVDGREGYAFTKRELVPLREGGHCRINHYEIPPGKANYPYHYHGDSEEAFYILRGEGELKTPDGIKAVRAGDFLFFPAGEGGAHKLTNTSETEPLVYIDFDTTQKLDVSFYPETGKVGVWTPEIGSVFQRFSSVDYYQGE